MRMLPLRICVPFSLGLRATKGLLGVPHLKPDGLRSFSAAVVLIWNLVDSCLRRNFCEDVPNPELLDDLSLLWCLSPLLGHQFDTASNGEHYSAGESGEPCVVIERNGSPRVASLNLHRCYETTDPIFRINKLLEIQPQLSHSLSSHGHSRFFPSRSKRQTTEKTHTD